MKKLYLLIPLLLALPSPVFALDISASPICFNIINEAPYRIYGQVTTDYFTTASGAKARHTGTFRLEKPGTRNSKTGAQQDRSEFCSTGPFYPGRQLEITLRTLIPVFTCKTSIEMGDIIIKGQIKSDGTAKTWAVCY